MQRLSICDPAHNHRRREVGQRVSMAWRGERCGAYVIAGGLYGIR
jgi:hypothetical protein